MLALDKSHARKGAESHGRVAQDTGLREGHPDQA